ncbi:hypothetical protein CC2G_013686 [Coprinopsis cinerea AmutBmut pab1-1]|nr:hypothetical protein CC2G_013686 [Coprinopsis cinerea AmutBmut pab1-1]
MRWLSRPERRELILALFSISIYLFAYNLETSLNFVGIDPVAAQGTVLRSLGLGSTKVIGRDGRKPPGWRDELELEIFGSWDWQEGNVAGDGAERNQGKGSGRHGAQWVRRDTINRLNTRSPQDNESVNNARLWWGDDIPLTQVIKHAPGYSIVDNVFAFNGSVYLVTDDKSSLPPVTSIMETMGTGFSRWEVLTKEEGQRTLGKYGGIIRGVSWMSGNPSPYNLTLFDLWRLQSTLDPSIDAEGRTTLSPPHRLIFPHTRFFTDPNPPNEQHWIRRVRAETGFHPYLVKAAFPHLDIQYYEDWEDIHKMAVPFVYERLVVSDRKAAAASVNRGQPVNSPVFGLETSKYWWEPIRRTLALYFDRLVEEVDAASAKKQGFFSFRGGPKPVITFIDNQKEGAAKGQAVLAAEDYSRLGRSLRRMAREKGYEFHTVSTNLTETSWDHRMDTIVRSTIVLGTHGNHLLDSVWMRPSPKATLIEIFPQDEFVLTRELPARSIGINYVAWRGNQAFSGENLPTSSTETNQPVNVDANALANTIHEILARKER